MAEVQRPQFILMGAVAIALLGVGFFAGGITVALRTPRTQDLPGVPDVLECRQIKLVDEKGRVRIHLSGVEVDDVVGASGIVTFDENGATLLNIFDSGKTEPEDRISGMCLFDPQKSDAHLAFALWNSKPIIRWQNSEGKKVEWSPVSEDTPPAVFPKSR